jgi:hypothetical protein
MIAQISIVLKSAFYPKLRITRRYCLNMLFLYHMPGNGPNCEGINTVDAAKG